MIPLSTGVRVWIAAGHTDMRRGMQSLALQVQEGLKRDPHAGDLYVFRGRSGSLIKILWHDGRHVALRQAAGARQVHLAGRHFRCHLDLGFAACLHAGRHRLAKPPAHVASHGGWLSLSEP
jgi:transposase